MMQYSHGIENLCGNIRYGCDSEPRSNQKPKFLFSSLDYIKFVHRNKPNKTDRAVSSYLSKTFNGNF